MAAASQTGRSLLDRFHHGAFEALLLRHGVPGFAPPFTVQRFSFGQSNPTFDVRCASGTRVVVRMKPLGKTVPGAHAVEREFKVLSALYGSRVPVPKAHLLCEDASVLGAAFYVMEFVEGRIFTDSSLQDFTASEQRAYYGAAVDVLAQLHRIRPADVGLEGFGKPTGYFRRQMETLSRVQAQQAKLAGPIPDFDAMRAWMVAHIPDDDATVGVIVHGDYKLDNIVFHPTEPRVLAVLDWEMSTIGQPMADVGNFRGYTFVASQDAEAGQLLGGSASPSGLGPADLVRMYCSAVGREFADPHDFYAAYFFFKASVISQGIAARVAQGNASSDVAAMFGAAMPMLAAAAARVMKLHDAAGSRSRL